MSFPDNLFSTILASTVHDMKNSLGLMLDALNTLLEKIPDEQKTNNVNECSIVQYESSRVNNAMMQLLAIYKLENNQLPLTPSYHNLFDFIEEQVSTHAPLLNAKSFSVEIDIEEDIDLFFDDSLIAMVISNVIGNAIRYAHSKLLITLEQSTVSSILICDDGPGYPAQMIEMSGNYSQGINQTTGSTGLGLFFAQNVAKLHKHNSVSGKVSLENGGPLGGGVFKITLP